MFALACVAFFTTCGGAFGIEPLIGAIGPGLAVALIIVAPFLWSLPMSLMVAELSTRMPEEGGYYVWVRDTLGPFWGVQEAWWTIGTTVALLAIFPVLFVSYLTFFFPALSPGADGSGGAFLRWLVAVGVTVTGTVVNLRGARDVGSSSKASAGFVLGAFLVIVIVWLLRGSSSSTLAIVTSDLASHRQGGLLLGLSIIVYSYGGWDNVSTYAAEVDEPQRNYPRAIALALVVALLAYLFPVLAGLSVTTDPAIWSSNAGWPVIAQLIGGRWLGGLIAAAGLVSMWGLFNAQLLYVSRLPYVMAIDGWLPKVFARASSNSGAPGLVIICLGVLVALLTALSFGGLAVIQGVLYTGALTLEFLSLIALRIRGREVAGSFRIPGGWWGMTYVCLAPFVFAMLVLYATLQDWRSYPGQIAVIAGVVVSGAALYFLRRRVVLR